MREKGMKRRKVEGDEKGTRGRAYLFYKRLGILGDLGY